MGQTRRAPLARRTGSHRGELRRGRSWHDQPIVATALVAIFHCVDARHDTGTFTAQDGNMGGT
jgi:hypothetical protein